MIIVVLATHNGEATLPTTLGAFARVDPPEGGVRYVAVDNNSRDGSADILRAHAEKLPLTVLTETRAGKVPAIERGLSEIDMSACDLIVFTDDDVIPDPDWLLSYERAAATHPEAALFAGQVRHHWEKEPPDWLVRLAEMGLAFAGTPIDLGGEELHWSMVKGLNFAVRPEVLETCHFRSDLWVAGSKIHGGEETDFARQVLERGHAIRFVSEARVKHIVRTSQIGVIPILRRYYGIGHSWAMTEPGPPETQPIWCLSVDIVRTAASGGAKALFWLCLNKRHRAMRSAIFATLEAGRLKQRRAMVR